MPSRRLLPLLLAAILCLLATSCRKARFSLVLELPASVHETYSLMYYASEPGGGKIIETALTLTAGTAQMECATVTPTLVYVFQGGYEPATFFYAERGDKIKITGDNASPATWNADGNSINEALSRWRRDNRDVLSARNPQQVNAAVDRYVRENPASGTAALLLFTYYDRAADPAGFDRLYKLLKDDAAEPVWAEITGRADLLTGYTPTPARIDNLPVRILRNGCDTLRPAGRRMLLYFGAPKTENRQADLLSIREAIRQRGDSANLTVAVISMEPDSISWAYQAPRDSLKGAVQAWLPLSFSSPDAIKLGISSIPTAIVADNGRIIYRGSDIPAAVKKSLEK